MRAAFSKILVVLATSVSFAACGDPTLPSPAASDPNPSPRLSDRADSGGQNTPSVPNTPTPVVDAGSEAPAAPDAGSVFS